MSTPHLTARPARFGSPEQVADYLLTTTSKLTQDRYLGTGLPYVKYGRKILYPWDAVDAYLEANLVTPDDAA